MFLLSLEGVLPRLAGGNNHKRQCPVRAFRCWESWDLHTSLSTPSLSGHKVSDSVSSSPNAPMPPNDPNNTANCLKAGHPPFHHLSPPKKKVSKDRPLHKLTISGTCPSSTKATNPKLLHSDVGSGKTHTLASPGWISELDFNTLLAP